MATVKILTLPIVSGATVKYGNDVQGYNTVNTGSAGTASFSWSLLSGTLYVSIQKANYVFSDELLTSKPSNTSWGASSAWQNLGTVYSSKVFTFYALPKSDVEDIIDDVTETLAQLRENLMNLASNAYNYAVEAVSLINSAVSSISKLDASSAKSYLDQAAQKLVSAQVQLTAANDIASKTGVTTTATQNAITKAESKISTAQSAINSAYTALNKLSSAASSACSAWNTKVSSLSVPTEIGSTLKVAMTGAQWVCSSDSSLSQSVTGTGKITFAGYEFDFPISNGSGSLDILKQVSVAEILNALGVA